jgi:hypothetical protein
MSSQDTILKAGNAAGETMSIPIPKGAVVNLHIPGLHYNSTKLSCGIVSYVSSDNLAFRSVLGGSPRVQAFAVPQGLAA